jgi:hypothetical protein
MYLAFWTIFPTSFCSPDSEAKLTKHYPVGTGFVCLNCRNLCPKELRRSVFPEVFPEFIKFSSKIVEYARRQSTI